MILPPALRLVVLVNIGPGGVFDAERVRGAVRGGATLLQVRGKDLDSAGLLGGAVALTDLGRSLGIPVVVNDRVDVALAVGADGVHVGPEDLPPSAVRRIAPGLSLGVSARTGDRVRAAEASGAAYLGVGAVRGTPSKPEAMVLGTRGVVSIARATPLPVVAIGGVRPEDVTTLRRGGVAGVAVLSGVLGATDPEAAARAYTDAWAA